MRCYRATNHFFQHLKQEIFTFFSFLAFADYSGGLAGIECEDWNVREGIEAIHASGGKVKVAYGGALYSMSLHVQNE